jgi:SAM-dependent methyltransferase
MGLSPFLTLWGELENSWLRVLIVGCGISTEPALLARLGYKVTAFDVSKVAISHVEANPASDDKMASWLISELPESLWEKSGNGMTLSLDDEARQNALRQTLDRLARPNGSLTTTYADFRELRADDPFDIVYSPWSWQCLDAEGRAALPRSAYGWLAPGGVAYFATQNITRSLDDELSAACTAAGFFPRSAEADRCQHQLRAGGKMWTDFRASG